jgi:hypothetical protein
MNINTMLNNSEPKSFGHPSFLRENLAELMTYNAFFENKDWRNKAIDYCFLSPEQRDVFAHNGAMEYDLFSEVYGTKEFMTNHGVPYSVVTHICAHADMGKDIERKVFDHILDGKSTNYSNMTKWLLSKWDSLGITSNEEVLIASREKITASYIPHVIGKMTDENAVRILTRKQGTATQNVNMMAWRGTDKKLLMKRLTTAKKKDKYFEAAIHNPSINAGDVFWLSSIEDNSAKEFVQKWQTKQSSTSPMEFADNRYLWSMSAKRATNGVLVDYDAGGAVVKKYEATIEKIWEEIVSDEKNRVRRVPCEYIHAHADELANCTGKGLQYLVGAIAEQYRIPS